MTLTNLLAALSIASSIALVAAPAAAETCTGTATAGATKLTLQATGLRNGDGEVAFTVYPDDKRRFLSKGGKLVRARVPARAPVTAACFWLPPGHYAVAQYHDENGDHSFNRTLFAPKEGFGFSNDAPTSIGLPSFEATRFALPAGGATMRMAMRYRR
jgi:uncharacterized protein (DUF2141 family)